MTISPAFAALIGLGFLAYGSAILFAALWRPTLLSHPLLRPRWWGFGPRATRIASGLGSGAHLVIGSFLIAHAAGVWPATLTGPAVGLIFLLVTSAAIAQLVSPRDDAA
jgi:hypothetical protein